MKQEESIRQAKKDKTSSFRTTKDTLNKASAIYEKLGLSLSDAIHIFLVQSVEAGGFPFRLNTSLASTLRKKASKKLRDEILKGVKRDEDEGR